MQLNEKLSMLRQNNNYSTRQLAEKLGVSQSSISLWEKGDRKPDYGKIVKLANIYGVSTDYLLGTRPQGVKSKLSTLNEQRNIISSKINMTQMKLGQLDAEIEHCQKNLEENQIYRNKISNSSEDNNSEKSVLDLQILALVEKKINELSMQLQILFDNRSYSEKNLKKYNRDLEHIIDKCQQEEDKVQHITRNFSLIDSKDFKDIHILSEYELQIIILKYLDLYYIFEQSNIDIDEFISKLKLHVHSDFWSNR